MGRFLVSIRCSKVLPGIQTGTKNGWILPGSFWHRECVCEGSEKVFANQYRKWCAKAGYKFSVEKAASIYTHAISQVDTLPMTDAIKCLVTHAVAQLNMIIETISVIQHEMLTLASRLPEYPVVMRMFGVGPVLGLNSWRRSAMCAVSTASNP